MRRLVALAITLAATLPVFAGQTTRLDIVATAQKAGNFKLLLAAAQQAGLVETLRSDGPLTLFAPTDEAFGRLPEGTLESLLAPAGREQLRAILSYHVVAGAVRSSDLLTTPSANSVSGAPLAFGLRVGNANVLTADLECSNGVIHVIDTVLLPPTPEAPMTTAASSAPADYDLLREAIDRGAPLYNEGHIQACADTYAQAARSLLEHDLALLHREELTQALGSAHDNPKDMAWALRHAFDRLLADESFEPRIEASMPPGFPAPGPVARVVVKEYPRYRAARAEGGNSFWALFRHIQKNGVEMTAPVEMTMDGSMRARDMSFLYERSDQGRTGADGSVAVMDVLPSRVLSIGMRGQRDAEGLATAKRAIEARLQAEGLAVAGPWRVLGYNSPMVPAARQYWELQVPFTRD